MVMDKCQICSSKSEHTHHIKEQKIANENNIIEHFHKNIKHNLVQLYESCHYKVHNGNLRIIGYEKTNNGINLNYKYIDQQVVVQEKKKNKKFNESQIETIQKYYHESKNKRNCISKLELNENINISLSTLNKIINNLY